MTLQVNNLSVKRDGKLILDGFSLSLEKGNIYALMGSNGSGKSTLAYTLMGHPKYEIVKGEIILNGKNINGLNASDRAKLGLFLSFQSPTEVSGVSVSNFLRQAYNSVHEKKLSVLEFRELLNKKSEELEIDKSFLSRYLNEGFSGGEKKKMEILQMLVINPRIIILDETDSGLDIHAIKVVTDAIKKFADEEKTFLIITHYQKFIDDLKPVRVFRMDK